MIRFSNVENGFLLSQTLRAHNGAPLQQIKLLSLKIDQQVIQLRHHETELLVDPAWEDLVKILQSIIFRMDDAAIHAIFRMRLGVAVPVPHLPVRGFDINKRNTGF
jgi:hypothetical protein